MTKSLKLRVAERIAYILEKKGLKQKDLVEKTGLGKSYVSLILSGDINLTLETIELIEKALKAPIVRVENRSDDFTREVIIKMARG